MLVFDKEIYYDVEILGSSGVQIVMRAAGKRKRSAGVIQSQLYLRHGKLTCIDRPYRLQVINEREHMEEVWC